MTFVALTAVVLLTAAVPAGTWMSLSVPEREKLVRSLEDRPLRDRLLAASERFIGTPYVFNPLGEGQGKDPDPMIRFDEVDCLTFVETTMALSLAKAPQEVDPVLQRIRYRGSPAYEERNHLMEADWIPNNLAKGFIADVTREYGGADTVLASKTYTPETWASTSAKGLGLPEPHQAKGTFSVSMIPISKFKAKASAIPSGTIVVVVRKDGPDKVTRISHLGFLVHKKGGVYMRHAALGQKAVVDEPLDEFLARHSSFATWPVDGFSLYAVGDGAQK
jgi:hypothetical protein